MSRWATIDKTKLEAEIRKREAAINMMTDGKICTQEAMKLGIKVAENNALIAVFNCLTEASE